MHMPLQPGDYARKQICHPGQADHSVSTRAEKAGALKARCLKPS